MKKPIPFGKYYLLERINVGGMAEVFKAKAYGVEGFERLVAVKRILPNIAEDEEFITMFIDEAKIAVQLNHANIAQIFDLGKVDDSYFIALEYVHGRDLRAMFDRCRSLGDPMPIAQACFIIMKLCEGLDYAHNKRDPSGRELHLVHRDVSPQNVLISIEGEVKIIDFGIAKAAGKASKTQAGILKGKFGYMSPEQVRGLPIDRRSDVFSVGIVLYELLTGERLFVGESDFSTLEKVRNVEILPPSTYNRKIPEELERIVLKTLAKDVDERYQNAIDLHDDLQAFMYSSGEFYARKDLAAWMKKIFAKEIDEESRKLEAQRKLLTPEVPAAAQPMRRTSQSMPAVSAQNAIPTPVAQRSTLRGIGAVPPPPPPAALAAAPAAAPAAGGHSPTWEDEELQTQIYDRPPDAPDEAPPAATLPIEMRPASMMPVVPEGSADGVQASTQGPSGGWALPAPEMPRLQMPETEDFGLGLAIAEQAPAEVLQPVSAKFPRVKKSSTLPIALAVAAILVVASAAAGYYFLVFARRPATLFLAANPVDATVVLDDEKQTGSTPMTLQLRPGSHVVEVSKPGFLPFAQTVEAKAGQRLERIVQLEAIGSGPAAKPPEPPVAAGRTDAGAPPAVAAAVKAKFSSAPSGAKVYLVCEGKRTYQGTTPFESKLDPGKQCSASLELAGYKPFVQELQPEGKTELMVDALLEKSGPEEKVKPVVALAPKEPREPKVKEPKLPKEPREPKLPKEPREPKVKEPKLPKEPKIKPPKEEGPDVKPPPAAAKTGYLRINSKPWTRIYIDGRDTGLTTPQTKISLPAGRHSVTLVNNPFNIKHAFSITIQAGETATKVLDLRNPEQQNE